MTDTQVSTREVPWMKLGKLVDEPMTAAEAAKLGGLDFTVEKRALFYEGEYLGKNNLMEPIKDRNAIVRTDTWQWLGIMSKDYPLLQYREAFDFMDTIDMRYVAAGALKDGRQGFMVVETDAIVDVLDGDDPHKLYAVLRTSHDGTRAIEVAVMPLRYRCMNQLTLQSFTKGVPHRWAVRHTGNVQLKLHDAVESVKNLTRYAESFELVARRLVRMKMTDDEARETLEAALPDRPRRAEQVEQIISTWHTSETVGFDWTGWGLVNATSDYFDWQRAGGSPESRFVGALQGQTYNAINRVTGRLLSRL